MENYTFLPGFFLIRPLFVNADGMFNAQLAYPRRDAIELFPHLEAALPPVDPVTSQPPQDRPSLLTDPSRVEATPLLVQGLDIFQHHACLLM